MGRRRKKDSGPSLDSLLDTLTNVIGILVIILIVTQLGVSDAVKRISAKLPDVSEAEYELAKQETVELQRLLEELDDKQKKPDRPETPDPATVENQKLLIANLKKDIEQLKKASIDNDKLKTEIKKRETTVATLEKQIDLAEDRLATLKALLDKTPQPGPAPPPKTVFLPNPRSAPKGIKPVLFWCKDERLYFVNEEELRTIAQKQIDIVRGNDPKGTVNCKRLIDHFEKRQIGNRTFRLKAKVSGGIPYLVLEPKKNAGDEIERFKRSTSQYQLILRRLDKSKFYCRYLVWSDAFDVYLEARNLASKRQLLGGWIPYNKGYEYRLSVGVRVTCSDQPPPKLKPTPPKPPTNAPPRKPLPPNDDVD